MEDDDEGFTILSESSLGFDSKETTQLLLDSASSSQNHLTYPRELLEDGAVFQRVKVPFSLSRELNAVEGATTEEKGCEVPAKVVGSVPPDSVMHDYESRPDPRLQAKVNQLERENQVLLNRLSVLEALVFQGEGESSAFLHRLGDRLGEVDRWILQHERLRNHIIRQKMLCGFVPDHTAGNAPGGFSEIGSFGLLSPLFQGL